MTSDNLANPGPLGLLGFGLTTILLSVHNLGFFGADKTIMVCAIFLGGLAQVIAGLIEFKRNKPFTATVFTFFGMFWLAYAALHFQTGFLGPQDPTSTATMFLLFTILVGVLLLGTLKGPKTFMVAFLLLFITLLTLTVAAYTGEEIAYRVGGAFGLATGALVFYIASAEILNEQYQKPVLPLF